MIKDTDIKFMGSALAMARRGMGMCAPNPFVGAVIVSQGENGDEIIARAVTGPFGIPHGEPQAIEIAGVAAKGATLYVTLEPCNHQGRTPPCTEAIIAAGLGRVVIGSVDRDARVAGQGILRLQGAGIEVVSGVCQSEADLLNAGHFLRQTESRPYTIVKIAVASDDLILPGRSGLPGGDQQSGPRWVTSPLARARGALLRAEVDGILVGTNTALIDDPVLSCRLKGLSHRSPRSIVLDKDLKLPDRLQLFDSARAVPTLVVCGEDVSSSQKSEYLKRHAVLLSVALNEAGQLDLKSVNVALANEGITRLLVEGGPKVSKSYLELGLVDELIIFKGAVPAGVEGQLAFDDKPLVWAETELGFEKQRSLRLRDAQHGDNLMERYVLAKS